MGELGFLGPTLPARYGCAGLSSAAYGLLMYELERGDSGLRSFASVQGSLVMYPIFAYGSEAQKDYWLPRLASGEADRLLRPDRAGLRLQPGRHAHAGGAGADSRWRSTARRCGSPTARIADVAVVWARTDDGIRGFLVEKGTPGFTAPEMKGKWSLRASVTSELVLEDVLWTRSGACCPG